MHSFEICIYLHKKVIIFVSESYMLVCICIYIINYYEYLALINLKIIIKTLKDNYSTNYLLSASRYLKKLFFCEAANNSSGLNSSIFFLRFPHFILFSNLSSDIFCFISMIVSIYACCFICFRNLQFLLVIVFFFFLNFRIAFKLYKSSRRLLLSELVHQNNIDIFNNQNFYELDNALFTTNVFH